jgi:L-threonylcarbamoyladenylate synthase
MMEIIKEKEVDINKVANSLKTGIILVIPTDTIYGLTCDMRNKKSVDRIFNIKKRDKDKPIPVFVKDIKMAKSFAKINKDQESFLNKVWPGKVTVVLERKKANRLYGIDKKTIALRVPDHKLIKNIFKKIDFPVSGTSANVSGKEQAISIKEVVDQFKKQKEEPDLLVDGGRLERRKSSVIFDLTTKPYKILRQ